MSKENKYIKETGLGYYLQIKYHGYKRYSKIFHTIDYGSKENAKKAAINDRENFLNKNNLDQKRKHDDTLPIGVNKTCDTRKDENGNIISETWYYQAYWTVNKKQKSKRFPIHIFGDEKARTLAIQARLDGQNVIKTTSTVSTLFLPPNPSDVKIWRYMDFTKFVSILENGGLFFPSVELMDDYFEGTFSSWNSKLRSFIYSRSKNKQSIQDLIDRIKEIKKYILLSCWYKGNQESAAMWKLYAQTNEAICIQTTYKSLRKCLKSNFQIGEVKYIDYNKHWIPEDNIYNPFFYKRDSFKHENELRAIIDLSDKKNKKFLNEKEFAELKGIWVKINLNYFIRKIYVAPQSPLWFYNLVKKISKNYGIEREVEKSSIDIKPMF
ncbi:MAG: AP2 domain-containing protein [Ignavibacteriae bacterium]|nr:AP2 domain-containing protein [Ignavibacteriota bacterium]